MRKLTLVLACSAFFGCGNSIDGNLSPGDYDASDDDGVFFDDDGDQASNSGGQAELSWTASTIAVDGSSLTNLVGYRVYYGTAPAAYSETIDVGNATTATITELPPATYYFAVTAYDSDGNESALSGEVSKVVD